jgi:hypothetical protein
MRLAGAATHRPPPGAAARHLTPRHGQHVWQTMPMRAFITHPSTPEIILRRHLDGAGEGEEQRPDRQLAESLCNSCVEY